MFHGVIKKITLAQFFFETRCTSQWLSSVSASVLLLQTGLSVKVGYSLKVCIHVHGNPSCRMGSDSVTCHL